MPPGALINGNIVVDPRDGTVYTTWTNQPLNTDHAAKAEVEGLLREIYLARSGDGGKSWTNELVRVADGKVGNIFPVVALDTAGNPYVSWVEAADEYRVLVTTRAKDAPGAWRAPVQVSAPGTTNVFAWVVAGTPGRAALAWYGADYVGHPHEGAHDWFLEFAQVTGLDGEAPAVARQRLERVKDDHFVCTRGLQCLDLTKLGSPGRELGDFLTLTIGHRGEAHVAYNGNPEGGGYTARYVRQACGPSLLAHVGAVEGRGACAPLGAPAMEVPPYGGVALIYQPGRVETPAGPVTAGGIDPFVAGGEHTILVHEPVTLASRFTVTIDPRNHPLARDVPALFKVHALGEDGARSLVATAAPETFAPEADGASYRVYAPYTATSAGRYAFELAFRHGDHEHVATGTTFTAVGAS